MTHIFRVCNDHTIRPLSRLGQGDIARKGRKSGLFSLGLAMLVATTACHRQPPAPTNQDAANSQTSAELIQEADSLYAGREDPMKVVRAIVDLRRAAMTDGGNYDVAWRLARLNYYLGSHSTDVAVREKAFREGIQAGMLAVKLQDGKPEGHFWLGANYGGSAQDSMLSGLSEVEDIRREMETVIRLDERYQSGSAYMVLGQTYLEAPLLLGGDRYKAVDYLEKSLRFGPTNALARFHLAEAYLAVNRKDDARKQVEALFAMKPDPDFTPEHNDAVAQARKLQEKLK
jgi:tetratricopeptide (TPR) repeat protein